MKAIKLISIMLMLAVITGCAGTDLKIDKSFTYSQSDTFEYNIIDNAGVSEEGMKIFKARIANKFNALGLSRENPTKIVEISFTNYYMRHGAARALVGIMAGADNITSKVVIREKHSGEILGSFNAVSTNPTAHGTSKSLIEQHADKIAFYVKSGKT